MRARRRYTVVIEIEIEADAPDDARDVIALATPPDPLRRPAELVSVGEPGAVREMADSGG